MIEIAQLVECLVYCTNIILLNKEGHFFFNQPTEKSCGKLEC